MIAALAALAFVLPAATASAQEAVGAAPPEVRTRAVLVASRAIRPGEPLTREVVALEQRRAWRVPRDAVVDPAALEGLRARRSLPAGSVIRRSRLEASTDVQRGERIRVVLQQGALRIETSGRARQDGNAGDWIEAQTEGSRHLVIGRLGPDGALHVQP